MKHLHILWTNADIHIAQYMVMMYATNAMLNGWWDKVTVILWGATAKLAAESDVIKDRIVIAKQAGVEFSACIACANQLGVGEALRGQEIELKGWGEPLTELIQTGAHLLTI